MGDTTNTAPAGESTTEQDPPPAEAKAFEAITSQEDLDRVVTQRLARERNKFADYDDLKAKASKLEQLEDANKTAEQKVADRLKAAEDRATELESKALRTDIATSKSVPAALLSGSTKEELEASADALIAFRGEQKKPGPVIPNQGKTPLTVTDDPARAAVRQLFGNN